MDLERLKKASKVKHGSQYGEAGVMDSIFKQLDIVPKYAVEFGSGTVDKNRGTANIRYFYDEYGCECLYFETSQNRIDKSGKKYKKQIKLETVKASNINNIFNKYKVPMDLDMVVIDVDGQDYWIWDKLEYTPKILQIEFNPTIPLENNWVMHKDENHFKWRETKCLYYGASIGALKKLGIKKGYSLVFATNRNLIFVSKDLVDIDIPLNQLFKPGKDKEIKSRTKYINKPKWINVE